jgi:hypothetical protein
VVIAKKTITWLRAGSKVVPTTSKKKVVPTGNAKPARIRVVCKKKRVT